VLDSRHRFDDEARDARPRLKPLLSDEARFIKTLFENPRATGAVSPSGRFLAKAMARAIDPKRQGLIVELGPGTGPVTKALIERGVPAERLVLVEYDPAFCRLLTQRFPGARIVQGDAYSLSQTLAELAGQPIAAVVSSLPLLNQPLAQRSTLIAEAFALMGLNGVFVQFTYGIVSPVPRQLDGLRLSAEATAPIWLNLPPARVWTYRQTASSEAAPKRGFLHEAECAADEWAKRAEAAARAFKERQVRLKARARAHARDMIEEARRSKTLALLRRRKTRA
jgi:phosphatidylethanolamine/phosphatidyl-N-methylethanolamine N-methyltransferase